MTIKKKTKALAQAMIFPPLTFTHLLSHIHTRTHKQLLALTHIFIALECVCKNTHVLHLQRVTLKIPLQLPWQGFYKYHL